MTKNFDVVIIKKSHADPNRIGNAEGIINGREFVASWCTREDLGGTFFDDWLDTTSEQNEAIAKVVFVG